MDRRRMVAAFPAVIGAIAIAVLVRPTQAQLDGETIGCGVAAPWVVYATGYDPTGAGDPPEAYAEFRACRDAAAPLAAVGFVGVAVSIGLVVVARRPSARRGDPPR